MHSSPARNEVPATRGSLLLVDDERSLLEAISRYLTREGYDVRVASTARAALAALEQQPVEVMLCDVGLPDMEAAPLVRSARRTVPGLVVLMFSGWHDPRVADALLEAGASAYVTKPMPLRDLGDIVEQAVRERRAAADPPPRDRHDAG